MIQEFVDAFLREKELLRKRFLEEEPPRTYMDLVSEVLAILEKAPELKYPPHSLNIHEVDPYPSEYEGSLIYVVGCEKKYGNIFWAVKVDYGSCRVCDPLQWAMDQWMLRDKKEAAEALMILSLHIIQNLKLL